MHSSSVPDFDDLPAVEGMPQGCAWGIFDKDGKKDLRGTLNLLTQSVVAEACKEARDGVSISLKSVYVCGNHGLGRLTFSSWPLNGNKVPMGRMATTHKVAKLTETGLSKQSSGWDDEISFNTQVSKRKPDQLEIHAW
jgi:hypothetical protein